MEFVIRKLNPFAAMRRQTLSAELDSVRLRIGLLVVQNPPWRYEIHHGSCQKAGIKRSRMYITACTGQQYECRTPMTFILPELFKFPVKLVASIRI